MSIVSLAGRAGGFVLLCVVTVLVWVCSFLLGVATGILGVLSGLISTFGVLVFVLDSRSTGLQMLFVAFLFSRYGLPTAAAWLLGWVNRFRASLVDYVF